MLYSLLKLRQACNHPWLVRGAPRLGGAAAGTASNAAGSSAVSAAEVAAARKLAPQQRKHLLSIVKQPQAQCPLCLDVPEDPAVSYCGHVYCRQCVAGQLDGTGM